MSVGITALTSFVPVSWRYPLKRLLLAVQALPDILRSQLLEAAPEGPPRVYYGLPALPSPDEFAHGGMVKVQRMQSCWPNSPRRFNTLYMVSSAPPPAARWQAAAARRRGVKVVWNQNGVSYPGWEPRGWASRNATMRPLLLAADHVFYQSLFCKESADRFLGEPRGSWEVLHNAVDTNIFLPRPEPLPVSPLVLMLGGNQSERYRVESAVGTLAVLVRRGIDARLLITGKLFWGGDPATAAREAREIVEKEGVISRVEFVGPYSQAAAPALLRGAHILLHTKHNDPCPGVVVEALASGLPVVYSASGGVPELVGEEGGVGVAVEATFDRLVSPEPQALAEGVLRVMASLADYQAAARRRAVERFDIGPWLARHAEIFARGRR